ncbi:accessory gene regulator B [Ruminiclostridium sufflavum DSM 19573]|uniref:Accessory gene regulator B n=1 Tax=Ruminiclostridium sufflavum DSM 19573 TaxID=1121337 RepID=A0A318XFI1_9FIRM|nr:accessory gene regulator B family protein [Ruminiclostridium sufflavum]PYG84263.1 accessory gene regulator B [Ruminiclostridium sufflavum DSM 19573]
MKLIQKLSFSSAGFLTNKLQQDHRKRTEYYFGFQGIYQSIIKVSVLGLTALLLGIVKPMLFVILAFTSLRFFAGGTHMGTYMKCFLITILTFVPASLAAKYFSEMAGILFIIASFTISAAPVALYAPKNSPLNQISAKKARMLKLFSIAILTFWFVISVCLYLFQQTEPAISVCIGILLEVSSIIPAFEKLYNKFDKIGAKND